MRREGLWLALAALVVVALFAVIIVHFNPPRDHSPPPMQAIIPRDLTLTPVDESELYPIWEDDYTPLPQNAIPLWPHPPWPRGLSEDQRETLLNADRIIVGRLNPYPAHETAMRFHQHEVYGTMSLEKVDDVEWFVEWLERAIPDDGAACSEFYPEYAVRIRSGHNVLDILIEPDCGMYALSAAEQRYCQSAETAFQFLENVMADIPKRPPDDENP